MADAVFSFELEGNGDAALEQADALEKLREKLLADTAALSEMNKAFRALKGTAHAGSEGFKRLKDQVAAQKAAIANSHAQFIQLGGDFKKLKRPTQDARAGFDQFVDSAKGANGPLGRMVGSLQSLSKIGASGVIAAGLAGIAAAFLTLAAASVAATAALFKFGIAAADAYRSERLQLEGLSRVRNWFGLAADKADFMHAAIDKVAAKSALAKSEISGLATGLQEAGMRGGAYESALEGLATVSAVAGHAQADMYRQMFLGARTNQGAIRAISNDIKARFGAVARAQMLSLGVQSRKLKESFAQLFSGLKIERFLDALHDVTDLFSQNTVTGRVLKGLLETVFQPLADFATGYGIHFKRFFQGMTTGVLLVTLGVLKLRNWFRKTFGDSEILAGIDKQRLAVYAGAAAVGALAAALVGLAAIAAVVVAPFVYIGYRVYKFVGDLHGAYQAIKAIDWPGAGRAVVDGIANGIKNGAKWVIDAVKNLGASALKAFKDKIQSKSPSKLFTTAGFTMPQGAAVGVKAGTPLLTRAVRDMGKASSDEYNAAPAPAVTTSAQQAPTAAGRRSRSVALPPVNLTFNIQADSKTDTASLVSKIREIVRDEIPLVFEGIAIHMAAAEW